MTERPQLSRHETADLRALANGGQITHGTAARLKELGLAVYYPFSGWRATDAGLLWVQIEEGG